MPVLNRDQRIYAIERINKSLRSKLNDLKEKYTKPAKNPLDKDKMAAIRDGEVPLRRGAKLSHTLEQAFDFSSVRVFPELDYETYQPEADRLQLAANLACDAVMLGDEKQALKLIEEFCKET